MPFSLVLGEFEETYTIWLVVNVRIPQELVNAIIDSAAQDLQESRFYWVQSEPPVAATLRACSLVSRSFLGQSRMHLFAFINCWNEHRVHKFGRLLLESPHIGPLYVRHFRLCISDTAIEGLSNTLLCSTNLTHLELISDARHPGDTEVGIMKDVLVDILSSCPLRSLALCGVSLRDADAFTALLNQASTLEELSLDRVHFSYFVPSSLAPTAPTISLQHLSFINMYAVHVNLVLSVLDTSQMRSVICALSTASARRHFSVRPTSSCASSFPFIISTEKAEDQDETAVDQDILQGNASLQSIEITDTLNGVAAALEDFGNLRHLTALKTISLHVIRDGFHAGSEADGWARLDSRLASVRDVLQEVCVYFYDLDRWGSPTIEFVKQSFPSVAGRARCILR
ncbi:hypothetical protein C8J57DRAFT_1537884 [Mycena rebaudengoi]|nr:hypothetical protein C8J57DRAFT_1537884 [Mycena rebaudengoi]